MLAVQLLHLTREFVLLFLVLVFGLVDCGPAVLTFLKDLLVLLLLSQIVTLAVVLKHLVPVAFVIVDGGNLVVTFLLDGDLILSFFVVSFKLLNPVTHQDLPLLKLSSGRCLVLLLRWLHGCPQGVLSIEAGLVRVIMKTIIGCAALVLRRPIRMRKLRF